MRGFYQERLRGAAGFDINRPLTKSERDKARSTGCGGCFWGETRDDPEKDGEYTRYECHRSATQLEGPFYRRTWWCGDWREDE